MTTPETQTPGQKHQPPRHISNAPVKIYKLVNTHTFTTNRLEIQHNGSTILWVHSKTRFLASPQVNLHTQAENGPIAAACKLESFSRDCRLLLGNPDCTDKKQWPLLVCEGWAAACYCFRVDGRVYQWKRTHRAELGARVLGDRDYKLVDGGTGAVLATHIYTQSLFRGKLRQIADISFFVELGPELELTALAAIMGIEERIRQNSNG